MLKEIIQRYQEKKNKVYLGSMLLIFLRQRRPGLNVAIQCFLNRNYWKNVYKEKYTDHQYTVG